VGRRAAGRRGVERVRSHYQDLYDDAQTSGCPRKRWRLRWGAESYGAGEIAGGRSGAGLGSGGGIDVLLSAKRVGPTGKAYGLDMTDEMLALARRIRRR